MKHFPLAALLMVGCSTPKPPYTAAASQQAAPRVLRTYDASSSTSKEKPLVFVNGRKYGSSKLRDLAPTNIDSITIIKPPMSTTTYGKKGRYGVLLITTKEKN